MNQHFQKNAMKQQTQNKMKREEKIMSEKICPLMAQGYMSNPHQNSIKNLIEACKKLPKCLKENCALWVDQFLGTEPHCGLKNENKI